MVMVMVVVSSTCHGHGYGHGYGHGHGCGMRVVVLNGGIGAYDVYICIYICHNIICQNDDINDIRRDREMSVL